MHEPMVPVGTLLNWEQPAACEGIVISAPPLQLVDVYQHVTSGAPQTTSLYEQSHAVHVPVVAGSAYTLVPIDPSGHTMVDASGANGVTSAATNCHPAGMADPHAKPTIEQAGSAQSAVPLASSSVPLRQSSAPVTQPLIDEGMPLPP